MASTFTPNLTLEEPANGDDVNTWDVPVNNNTTNLDIARGGNTTVNVTSASGTVNLTITQYRPPNITFNGTLGANLVYQLPGNVGGVWSVFNNATGNFSLTMASAGGGRTTVIPQGYRKQVVADAVNVDQTDNTPASPAGNNTWVQFNNAGSLGASSSFTWDGANVTMPVLKLFGSSSGYLAFQAPTTVTTPLTFTLPNGDGTTGQVLSTNGAGTLSWITTAGGGGVTTFNGRSGVVTLTSSDVTSALTYVPVNPAAPGNLTGLGLTITALPNANAAGFLGLPQESGSPRSGNFTGNATTGGYEAFYTGNGNLVLPPNSSVAYPIGTVIVGAADVGVTLGIKSSDTLVFVPSGGSGNRTVSGPGFCAAVKKKSTTWWLYGLGLA